jgi:hypothetical protein
MRYSIVHPIAQFRPQQLDLTGSQPILLANGKIKTNYKPDKMISRLQEKYLDSLNPIPKKETSKNGTVEHHYHVGGATENHHYHMAAPQDNVHHDEYGLRPAHIPLPESPKSTRHMGTEMDHKNYKNAATEMEPKTFSEGGTSMEPKKFSEGGTSMEPKTYANAQTGPDADDMDVQQGAVQQITPADPIPPSVTNVINYFSHYDFHTHQNDFRQFQNHQHEYFQHNYAQHNHLHHNTNNVLQYSNRRQIEGPAPMNIDEPITQKPFKIKDYVKDEEAKPIKLEPIKDDKDKIKLSQELGSGFRTRLQSAPTVMRNSRDESADTNGRLNRYDRVARREDRRGIMSDKKKLRTEIRKRIGDHQERRTDKEQKMELEEKAKIQQTMRELKARTDAQIRGNLQKIGESLPKEKGRRDRIEFEGNPKRRKRNPKGSTKERAITVK